MAADSKVSTVLLHNQRDQPYEIPLQSSDITAEDVCLDIAKQLDLRPITVNLFALRFRHSPQDWLPPNFNFGIDQPAVLEFRLRFKLPLLSNLNRLDENAFNYLYHQIRHDLIHNKICGPEKEAEVLGLCVMDMARAMEEDELSHTDMESKCKQFIPKDIWNKHLFFLKKKLLQHLVKFREKPRTIIFLKERYVSRIEDIVPSYLEEKFHSMMYREERFPVTIRINPFHTALPGISISHIGKQDWELLCSIDDLCFVSMRDDCTAEISRKTGIPVSFTFKTNQQLESFIALLDGYYRLSEKWTFNLCNDIQSPLLVKFRRMKCHGPVGEIFSSKKLAAHPNSQNGAFILRQSSFKLGNFALDFVLEDKNHPHTKEIELHDGKFSLQGETNSFASVPELISYYMTNPTEQVVLKECIPPSDYDRSPLLICRVENFVEPSIRLEEISGSAPHIISARSLQVYRGKKHVFAGKTCNVMKALWHTKGKKVPVAIKFLKEKNDERLMKEFLQMADRCVGWQCESLVNLRGIVLGNPQALVFDWLPHGPLDLYLQENRLHVELVELIEAASHIAKAVWFLNDNGIIHGNIRAHNVLVAEQSDSGFTVKLADTSILEYQSTDLHWIPPEFMDFPLLAVKFSTTDVWAMGTTLWEVLSYGAKPVSSEECTPEDYKQKYITGWRLPRPDRCPGEIYRLISECWSQSSDTRKQPQALVRDIHQILYQFIGTKRPHAYASLSSSSHSQSQTNDAFDTSDNIVWTTFGSEPCGPPMFGSGGTQSTFVPDLNHTGSNSSHCTQTTWLFEPFGSSPDLISTFATYTTGSIGTNYSARGIYEFGKDQLSIRRLIGEGAYGAVFLGELNRSDGSVEHVAVKRMKDMDNLPDHEELDDLQREFDLLKKLCHPNIVEVKGVVYDPGVLLVMEYLPMGSLSSHFLTCHTKPTARQLMKFVQDVSDGMEYLSSNKIVHRDLAARNLLVANDESVKISDFGLARIMDNESNCYTIRTSRKLPIKWYPPECLEQARFSEFSDVWSFGVTLYEIFSYGKEPTLPGMTEETNKDSLRVLAALKKGIRLPQPDTCPPIVYTQLMLPCWQENASDRPTFSNLVGIVREVATHVF